MICGIFGGIKEVKEANKALEPMPIAVTHPADAGCAPAMVMGIIFNVRQKQNIEP
jgi:hypothetical protein